MSQPKILRRYQVGIDLDHYAHVMIVGCIISAVAAALLTAAIAGVIIYTMRSSYEDKITNLETELSSIQESYENEIDLINLAHDEEVKDLNENITSLANQVEQLLQEDSADFEILRRYWYVFKDAVDNSGLSTELIKHVDDVCKEWDVNPHWMWMIWKSETGWSTGLDNKEGSGARGLGQIMPSTGKNLYENVLGRGTYTHTMAYDPFINSELSIVHIGRNIATSTMSNAIEIYSGGGGSSYYNKVVTNGKKYGITLTEANAHYSY